MTEDMKVQDYLKYYGNLEDFFDLELIKLSHFKNKNEQYTFLCFGEKRSSMACLLGSTLKYIFH